MKRYFSLDLEACKNANLDTTEWLFLENIKFVQHYEGNAVSGWCSKSKKALAEHLGISERKVFLMIDELCEKGFLIKHDETGFLKTTKKWDDICSMPAKNAEPKNVEPMQNLQSDYAKNAEEGMQNLQSPTYKKENKKDKERDSTPKRSKQFTFSLSKDTHFDNLSDEYKNALKIEIEALGMGLPYQAFVEALQAKASYKYKNFLLAYKNWAKKDFNKGTRTTKYDGMVETGQISKEVANTMDVLDRMKW